MALWESRADRAKRQAELQATLRRLRRENEALKAGWKPGTPLPPDTTPEPQPVSYDKGRMTVGDRLWVLAIGGFLTFVGGGGGFLALTVGLPNSNDGEAGRVLPLALVLLGMGGLGVRLVLMAFASR
jgi:hypothetical protein